MTEVETGRKFRWDPCVAHRGEEVNEFVARYFAQRDRKVFLVVGAGFDPRSRIVATRLSDADASVRGLFIRENRPDPPRIQLDWANANEEALHARFDEVRVEQVDIFGSDRAVVGGRNIIRAIRRQDLSGVTDVIVDVSRAFDRYELSAHSLFRRAYRSWRGSCESARFRRSRTALGRRHSLDNQQRARLRSRFQRRFGSLWHGRCGPTLAATVSGWKERCAPASLQLP